MYIGSINADTMKKHAQYYKNFQPETGIVNEREVPYGKSVSVLMAGDERHVWSPGMGRMHVLREGVSYSAIEELAKRLLVPVREVLAIFDLPQTTFNKKLRERAVMNGRDSELVLLLTELIDYGISVFNNEQEKFFRWMKKPNTSLGGVIPNELLGFVTGIQEVRNSLNRLEYGNLA